ncbi:uncharacterized protein YALI1_A18605g [Yarrowia lipolytica]|uniref:Uncharacterized protein n=1 Tax=Yarrowia lipolytica TaxID=4952 RepID=A0A1D8N5B6_YARLL|nr:hypothetical protein YALI1_A18605g [Yarrowia lipolytica]
MTVRNPTATSQATQKSGFHYKYSTYRTSTSSGSDTDSSIPQDRCSLFDFQIRSYIPRKKADKTARI